MKKRSQLAEREKINSDCTSRNEFHLDAVSPSRYAASAESATAVGIKSLRN